MEEEYSNKNIEPEGIKYSPLEELKKLYISIKQQWHCQQMVIIKNFSVR